MPHQGPLRWLDGHGWLVLLGDDAPDAEADAIAARVLILANLDRPMVVLSADDAPRQAEAVLERYTRLGGPGGEAFSRSALTPALLSSPRFLDLLSEAGILYLGGGDPIPLVSALHQTPALARIVKGFSTLQGLIIIGADGGASALGTRAVGPPPEWPIAIGLGFLLNTVIVPRFTRTADSPVLTQLDQIGPSVLGLGIPQDTALALGPAGQVETWGAGEVTAVVSTEI